MFLPSRLPLFAATFPRLASSLHCPSLDCFYRDVIVWALRFLATRKPTGHSITSNLYGMDRFALGFRYIYPLRF